MKLTPEQARVVARRSLNYDALAENIEEELTLGEMGDESYAQLADAIRDAVLDVLARLDFNPSAAS